MVREIWDLLSVISLYGWAIFLIVHAFNGIYVGESALDFGILLGAAMGLILGGLHVAGAHIDTSD